MNPSKPSGSGLALLKIAWLNENRNGISKLEIFSRLECKQSIRIQKIELKIREINENDHASVRNSNFECLFHLTF